MPLLHFIALLLVSASSLVASPTGLPYAASSRNLCTASRKHFRPLQHTRQFQSKQRTMLYATSSGSSDSCLKMHFFKYVEDIPSFIPAMKECMSLSHYGVDCYQFVENLFYEHDPSLDTQLSTLATYYGANKILKVMNADQTHPHHEARQGLPELTYQNHALGWVMKNFLSRDKVSTILVTDLSRRGGAQSQFTLEPTILDIAHALETDNTDDRHEKLRALKIKIQGILSRGGYILDHIIGSANYMSLIWYRYHDSQDATTNNFLQYLIDQGAPTSDRNLIEYYMTFKQVATKTQLQRYKNLVEMAVRYTSGSSEASLSKWLMSTSAMDSAESYNMVSIVQAYLDIFFPYLDFADSYLVISLASFVSALQPSDYKHVVYIFMLNGMSQHYVAKALRIVQDVYSDSKEKERLVDGLAKLHEALSDWKQSSPILSR